MKKSKIFIHTALLGLLQRSNGSVPNHHEWFYLSRGKKWIYDDSIKVVGLKRRRFNVPCEQEHGYEYPNNTLETVKLSDLSSCVKRCSGQMFCHGVSWSQSQCQLKYNMTMRIKQTSFEIISVHVNCSSPRLYHHLHSMFVLLYSLI